MSKHVHVYKSSLSIAIASVLLGAVATGDARAEGLALEEVVVTATRSQASLLDVPVAVSAMSGEELEAAGAGDLMDLTLVSPSMYAYSTSDPMATPLKLRGIGTSSGNPGFESSVGLYVDDVYRSRAGAALTTFFDMAGVEVLRGPQGTLFGKNTSAGAILQKTAPAEIGEQSASISGEAGNYNSYQVSGHVNVPLGDSVAFRLSGLTSDTDGFFENPATDDDEIASTDVDAIRAQISFEGNNFDGRLVYDYSEMETFTHRGRSVRADNRGGVDATGTGTGVNALFVAAALDTSTGGLGAWYWPVEPIFVGGAFAGFDTLGPAKPYDREVLTDLDEPSNMRQQGVTLHLNTELSDSISLRSITGWRQLDNTAGGDADFGPVALSGGFNVGYDFETLSQEFIFSGTTDRLSWVAGANYFRETIGYTQDTDLGPQLLTTWGPITTALLAPAGLDALVDPASFARTDGTYLQDSRFTQEEDSYGIFGQVTFDLTDQFSLIVGARYNSIEKEGAHNNLLDGGATDRQEGMNNYFDLLFNNARMFYLLGGLAAISPDWENSIDEEEVTWDAALQWRPTDELQVYAKYAFGFKSGGINLNIDAIGGQPSSAPLGAWAATGFDPAALATIDGVFEFTGPAETFGIRTFEAIDESGNTYEPEEVDSYEIGVRWEYMDGRGRVSTNVFYADYQNLQVAIFSGTQFFVVNAGSSESQGVEVENTFQATDDLTLISNIAYLDATYGNDVTFLAAGRDRGQSPSWSVVLGGRYNRPISEALSLYANANYSWYSEMFISEEGQEPLVSEKQDAYGVFGLTVGLRSEEGWNLSVFCQNCFDEEYADHAFNQTFFLGGSPMINPGAPREYGLRASYNFE